MSHNEIVSFIWQVAELLRGPYRPNQYKKIMLPLIVLRRLDCVLEPTKEKVLVKVKNLKGSKVKNTESILNKVAKQKFHNKSKFTFEKLKADPENISANLTNFMKGFSERARKIIEHFNFEKEISDLEKHNLLYQVVSKFSEIDLHPDKVSNIQMGYIFEELIRRFNEASNEEAGDHFTPREVIRLMVDLLFTPDDNILRKKGIIKTLFDPAGGTGGMLSVIALPDQLFYNTGIHTYLWIFTNRKEKHRRKKIQLIHAVSFFKKMQKSLGKKRHEITEEQKNTITKLYGDFREGEFVRIFDSKDFAYYRITVERPLKLSFQVNDEGFSKLNESKDSKGNLTPDSELRDYENVPLKEDIKIYMENEVLPHVPSAWIDESKTKIGYEINFNRYFYKYSPPRPLKEIETDLKQIEGEIAGILSEVVR